MFDLFIKHIAVPKTEQGIEECITGTYTDANVLVFNISDTEFDGLYDSGIAQVLNEIDGVRFDEYESDFIPVEHLSKCLQVFRKFPNYADCQFSNALKAGLNYGYGIYTEF